ncbi:MAG: Flp pilus assembly complex ATPase component TadA [Candidatus Omnitrophica bacterium]|nr:Flp pilus assembly complex ATPase component TadA [Candidatus Omnitrophota bacterium]MBU0878083.1 Flp pilus assembly complex ATPase component TadA [Candidatus Omnitrophota bacterium]MBU1133916.1 Flp pilus assembly complex ATPase component TadA [Candidatus Omnitrophota bacterium]MBU1366439.1 Flp pilus assembly complex ATPase component TadA [Candidatus Omnitrophota bacterium]MBU1809607.1 Flp pilus assembly complex ATPase component TadA [Candidatus Omnitrophota bacterium]
MEVNPKKDFTSLLVSKGLINREQLDNACKLCSQKGGSLSELLISLGYVSEKDLMVFFSTYLSIPAVKVSNVKIQDELLKLIPQDIAKKYMVMPLGKIGNILTLAVADPLNVVIFEDLQRLTGCQIQPVIAFPSELKQAFGTHYKESLTTAIEEIIKDSKPTPLKIIKQEKEEVKDEEILRFVEEAPVIKLADYILKKAVEEKASDILIEPSTSNSRVRYRIDGILKEVQNFPKNTHTYVISRIKVIANLNITEHRLPQDGRFRMNILGRDIDFRVSVLPTPLGEKIALRVLDKESGALDLIHLGFEDGLTKKLREDSASSYGMIIVCGPTGCGKTTSLYSILRHIYTPGKNIITVEDPIEYQLEGVSQVNVNYEVNLTFASSLRSILRQDPDVIMVGEIRDFDTADITIKAALTGHLVLSTLHTTTAAGSVTRLINMGVEPFLLSSTLIGVLAQRLARRLCPKCKEINDIDKEIKEKYKIKKEAVIYKPKGCRFCFHQGYKGRVALGEYLHLYPEIKKLVNERADEHTIKKETRKLGMRTLREDGILKVEKGLTSLEEVVKITAGDEDQESS